MNTSCNTSATACTDAGATERVMRPRLGRWIGLLAIGGAVLPSDVAAQQIDAGQLAITEAGQRVGVESFRIWQAGPNLNAMANVEPSGNRGGFQVGVELDGRHRPVRYQLRGPGNRNVEGTWSVDRVRIHMVTAEGERWKEVPSRGPSAVLETGVAHHYLVLLQTLQEAGAAVTVVVPSEGTSAQARLSGQEADEVTVDGRTIAATRYDLRIGSGTAQVWVDAEGRLLRVLDPATRREAIRLPPG
jgi:hypothetical protein